MPCDLVVREPRYLVEIDALRHGIDLVLLRLHVLGIAAGAFLELARGDEHRLADFQAADPRAGLHDGAAHLDAGYRRQLRHPFVRALAHVGLRHADPDRVRLDQNFIHAGLGRRQLDVFEYFRSPGLRDAYGFHLTPSLSVRSIIGSSVESVGRVNPPLPDTPRGIVRYACRNPERTVWSRLKPLVGRSNASTALFCGTHLPRDGYGDFVSGGDCDERANEIHFCGW